MSDFTTTRRSFAKGIGGTITLAALGSTASAQTAETWTTAETPTGNTLYDVERTANGVYAVGAGGIVLHRTDTGWERVLDGGPTGNGNSLYGADVTDDGERLWFVGASGAIGEMDVVSQSVDDHSAPDDVTNNFNDVAVTGVAGSANAYVAGDSGKVYYSFDDGATGTWDYTTPGSGSAVNAVDFYDARSGHIVDGNKSVFATDDGGTYDKIGLADANANFYAVDSDGADDVWIAGGGGMIHHWDGAQWTPADTGDASLRDIEVAGDDGLAVGGGGVVYGRDSDGWNRQSTPTGQNLKGVVRGGVDVAVGAGGTVIER
ncbi:WD40/YVTN/BNR-like repeat-containing protein [Haloarcula nitratireducens]|uniref:Uncharacterized protein n=1 Tax=Haloarcula nitratireducens TaxID=2487749 RepID=A0AAW4P918_9EURY|nr:hypothetical protein [Halomicroarcula nitratireducens]MBX0294364.1 hypothetical protein [Halomicroarcula nitratireducens]